MMSHSQYSKPFLVAGVAAVLSLGTVGCGKTDDPSSSQTQGVSDSAITAGVRGKLSRERNLDSSDITVATSNGAVTLQGSVPDTEGRAAAENATRSFAGVTSVKNLLNIQSPSVAESMKDTGEAAAQAGSDTWITTKVKSLLLADAEAKGLDVKVNTKDGVVNLAGKLTTQSAIDHVKALAMSVDGVKRVNTTALTVASR